MTARAIRSGLYVAIVICFAVACVSSGGDPDDRTADWEENFDKANHLSEARRHGEAIDVPPTEEAWAKYGGMVHDLVATTPGFPPGTGLTLAADASGQIDQALTKFGRTKKLLLAKGMLLRAQGDLDTDAARQRALLDESKRVFDEMDRLAP